MPRILVAESIAPQGVDLLKSQAQVDVPKGLSPEKLLQVIGQYEGLVLRSETKVTAEVVQAAKALQVIGRAGIGVDNIDLEAATSRGIAVVNAPTGNTVAAAEHTIALLLAMARNVPQAHHSLKEGKWTRSAFIGIEVRNKTLGIIGLGRVGSQVARRAQSFGMRLLAYDPFVAPDYARMLAVELVPFTQLLSESDFITLHTALTEGTHHLIGSSELAKMKPGSRLINVARGELIDEEALLDALEEGKLAGVALDVFSQEPPEDLGLVQHPKVVVTPHLGASTQEAQTEVSIEVAEQVLAVLRGEPAPNTVNAPFLPQEVHAVISPYLPVASLVGKLLTQLADGQFVGVDIRYEGEIAQHDTALLKSAVLAGLLGPVSDERVNLINAPVMAARRGLKMTEQKASGASQYSNLITATLNTDTAAITIGGTAMQDETHIVRVNHYWLDMIPSVPYLLFIEHRDQPGLIGAVGTITGRNDVNISFMEVGRLSPRGEAMMILGLDDPMPAPVLEEIRNIPRIDSARIVRL